MDDGEEDDKTAVPVLQKEKGRERDRGEGESLSKPSAPSLYPSWKRNSSDSEFSDPEGNAQSKLRYRKTPPLSILKVNAFSMHALNYYILKNTSYIEEHNERNNM